jgi:hypothetical protein
MINSRCLLHDPFSIRTNAINLVMSKGKDALLSSAPITYELSFRVINK